MFQINPANMQWNGPLHIVGYFNLTWLQIFKSRWYCAGFWYALLFTLSISWVLEFCPRHPSFFLLVGGLSSALRVRDSRAPTILVRGHKYFAFPPTFAPFFFFFKRPGSSPKTDTRSHCSIYSAPVLQRMLMDLIKSLKLIRSHCSLYSAPARSVDPRGESILQMPLDLGESLNSASPRTTINLAQPGHVGKLCPSSRSTR